jgi:hypothetical protein
MGRPRPGMLPTWPDTNKGGSLSRGSGQYDGGTPGSDGSDLDSAADETSSHWQARPEALRAYVVGDPAGEWRQLSADFRGG